MTLKYVPVADCQTRLGSKAQVSKTPKNTTLYQINEGIRDKSTTNGELRLGLKTGSVATWA
jgi:hypothetical protein